jgi:hypothetical protein
MQGGANIEAKIKEIKVSFFVIFYFHNVQEGF